jgi:predicted nucleotidyltransferase
LLVGTEERDAYARYMVSEHDKATIATLVRRYGAASVWLFGSSADRRKQGRDLDLAVEGVGPARFFQFVGELMLSLSQPVDVVALEKRSKLTALIRREGIQIYLC